MFEPREADLPVLFLVLVVLPLVAYILLGKWSETTKKREKIDLLAQLTTEEALKAEPMRYATATAPAIPFVYPSKNGIHDNMTVNEFRLMNVDENLVQVDLK
ncbi:hypothetical protein GH714_013841 [Hevea brasiliensis]|uniref:Uncharacterized protein n=1 Tax=Hevea brasiliensis TaxID=3981 RepID=A0A6A6KBM1_HEVBR|nr:hypothetical protein GH714_013841 [Hevea brasiliensis]